MLGSIFELFPTDRQTHGQPAGKPISDMKTVYQERSLVGLKGLVHYLLIAVYQRNKCHELSIKKYHNVRIDLIFCCCSNQNCWPA